MLVSYNWLKDFVKLQVEPHALAEKITRTGVEIAEVKHPATGLKKLVAGHVLNCIKLEGTHLHQCMVDVGEAEPIQIICGAPNVATDEMVIVALHGARIAGNEKIKRGKIRGIVSNGMICGLQEIGFSDSVVPVKYRDGIFVFPKGSNIQPGEDVYHALGMDDYLLDFDITPNRADTLSMEGAAYEVGAIIDQPVKVEPVNLKADGSAWTSTLTAEVDAKLAPKFYLRKVTGVKIVESPLWLQTRLWNAGIRPVNNVVDVTNYIMLLTGQPMHAYDARTFKTGKLSVRLAKPDETLTLLNEKEVALDPADIVITDGNQPVMLAGVMGGLNSEVMPDSHEVILEAAVFDGTLVRKSALRHANRTEASSRFEKGINWDNTQKALDMAALLLRNEASATILDGVLKGSDTGRKPVMVKTTFSYLNKVLGTTLTADQVVALFNRLNFETQVARDQLTVAVPARRWDITIPAHLVEEVGRLYGYDNLKSTQPLLAETQGGYSNFELFMRHVKHFLQGKGLMEALSYSLTSKARATLFTKAVQPVAEVKMPLNSSRSVMRQNLLTGLVDAASYNFARKETELAFFEQGRTYDHADGQFNEHEHVATLYSGHVYRNNWEHDEAPVDFYFIKGQLENLFTALGLTDIEYRAEEIAGMHPTRTAGIYVQGDYVGFIGMVSHALTQTEKPLRNSELYGYELDLEQLSHYLPTSTQAKPAPKFPAMSRDLSVLVDQAQSNQSVMAAIRQAAGHYLVKLSVIDVYQGEHLAAGKKSLAYQLTFLNEKATLTDDLVNEKMAAVTTALETKLQASVR